MLTSAFYVHIHFNMCTSVCLDIYVCIYGLNAETLSKQHGGDVLLARQACRVQLDVPKELKPH